MIHKTCREILQPFKTLASQRISKSDFGRVRAQQMAEWEPFLPQTTTHKRRPLLGHPTNARYIPNTAVEITQLYSCSL